MAYTNEDRARERLQRARSFLEKAHALMLQDDLVYRSALDDAVSAIKNNLQGYLLQRIALMPPGAAPIPWQEAVAGNRMPDLLRACSEAGLDLRGLDREIRRLNDERNSRTHDDPLRRVDTTQARQAVDLALLLHRRVQDGLKSFGARAAVPSVNLATRLPAPELAKVGLGRGVAAVARPVTAAYTSSAAANGSSAASASRISATAVANASPSVSGVRPNSATADAKDGGGPNDDEDALGDEDTAERVAVQSAVRRRWTQRVVVGGGRVAAFVLLGAVAGILLTFFTSGARPFAPRASTPDASQAATIGILPPNAFLTVGALSVGAPACKGGQTTIKLQNTSTSASIAFSAGSPDGANVTFSDVATATPAPTLFGSVAPGTPDILTLATPAGSAAYFHVVVTAQGGTAELLATSC